MVEWTIACSESQVEAACQALEELACLSASVEDANAQTDAEQALFGEPGMPPPAEGWQRSRIKAMFALETEARIARATLSETAQSRGWQDLGITTVPDLDWVKLTQSQFSPVAITPEFWIVPSWHEPPSQARMFMRLDPGLAFGTGTHPTTRMCLQWIASSNFARSLRGLGPHRVLDYGCGSGVLAIAAAQFAQQLGVQIAIDAVDLDPAAIAATKANAIVNHVPHIQAAEVDAALGAYQIVLANILATPLKVLAPLLCARLAPGASLVLAGILERQTEELIGAYHPWVDLQVLDAQEGWVLMGAQNSRPAVADPTESARPR